MGRKKGIPFGGLSRDRVAASRLAAVVEREIGARFDPKRVRRVVRTLETKSLLNAAAHLPSERLAKLLAELPEMTVSRAAERRGRYLHLFDPQRTAESYARATRELTRLIGTGDADRLLTTTNGRRLLETQARTLYSELSGIADRYGSLKVETGLYNDLVRLLEPERFNELALDAHHPIEQRFFAKFAEDWRLLGWSSTDDMPALPAHYSQHRAAPKSLPGMGQHPEAVLAQSLSADLRKHIKLDQVKDAAQLLKAYRAYYASSRRLRSALPVVEAVEHELGRRRSLTRLAEEAAKLRRER